MHAHTHTPITLHAIVIMLIPQRKLELENRLEEEKLRIELEKINLEKKNAVLEIRIKQFGEQSKTLYKSGV